MPTLCSPRRLHAFELKCQFSEFGWTMWFVLKDCTDDLYLGMEIWKFACFSLPYESRAKIISELATLICLRMRIQTGVDCLAVDFSAMLTSFCGYLCYHDKIKDSFWLMIELLTPWCLLAVVQKKIFMYAQVTTFRLNGI